MNITETVVEIDTNKVGIISEITENSDGKKYLVDFNGAKVWKNEDEILVYLIAENREHKGEFLND